jgi:hypothetical protein
MCTFLLFESLANGCYRWWRYTEGSHCYYNSEFLFTEERVALHRGALNWGLAVFCLYTFLSSCSWRRTSPYHLCILHRFWKTEFSYLCQGLLCSVPVIDMFYSALFSGVLSETRTYLCYTQVQVNFRTSSRILQRMFFLVLLLFWSCISDVIARRRV